jgi:hypothetical protein
MRTGSCAPKGPYTIGLRHAARGREHVGTDAGVEGQREARALERVSPASEDQRVTS